MILTSVSYPLTLKFLQETLLTKEVKWYHQSAKIRFFLCNMHQFFTKGAEGGDFAPLSILYVKGRLKALK